MSDKIEFDLSSMSRRDVILVIISAAVVIGVIVGVIIFLTQGNKRGPKPTPATSSLPTSTVVVAAVTPSPSLAPTVEMTIGPTPTLEPYAHTVQTGETLFAIIQFYGYRDTSLMPELLRINNMPSVDTPLQAGQTLLIPRQTPTAGPSLTPTIEGTPPGPTQDYTGCSPEKRCVSPDGQFYIHDVQPGDTALSIALLYNTKVDVLIAANNLSPANPTIFPGQKLNVPILVTMTPTLTPTGGPDSTATPTPTLSSPSLLAPTNNVTVARGETVILQWATMHPLDSAQNYLIVVTNLGTGEEFRAVTHANTYRLPENLQPGIGQSARYEWQILVITGADKTATPISGQDVKWAFTWGP